MKVNTGTRVMYNNEIFTVTAVERDNGRAVAVWCCDTAGEEFYLTVDVLDEAPEDVSINEEVASAESEICDRVEASYHDDACAEYIADHFVDDRLICSGSTLMGSMDDGYLWRDFVDTLARLGDHAQV